MSEANGVAAVLEEEVTFSYRPTMPLEHLWLSGSDMPQITLRRDLEFMQMHPVVMTALEYYKSGTSGAEFEVQCQDHRAEAFVNAAVKEFWKTGVPVIQDGYAYGWSPGEHVYEERNGYMCWSYVKGFHPNDGYILTQNYKPVGVRIKNMRDRNSYADLWMASGAVPAKACWYAHRPRFNQYYGRSQLIGAWRPWRRLGWRDAVEQVIDAAVYRAGFVGPMVHYPNEDMQTAQQGIPATQRDGLGNPRRAARDVARQIVEWAKSGAGFTVPSAQYPPAQGGGPKWKIEWPTHVMDVRPLIEAARYLEDQIMLGTGVPPELLRSGGTGSGYSGRSIPREAFLEGQQRVAEALLRMFVEEVLRPLVLWNFGDVPFQIGIKPLLLSQAENRGMGGSVQGQTGGPMKDLAKSDAAKDAWDLRAMSLERADRVKEIVRRVLRRAA